MSKKKGLAAFIVGMAAGAAALFLSKKENREKTKKAAKDATSKAKKTAVKAKKTAKKATAAAKKTAAKAKKAAKKSA